MKTKKRKSFLLVCMAAVLCLVFAFTFAACNKSDDDEKGSKTDSGNVSATDPVDPNAESKSESESESESVPEPIIDEADELILTSDDSGNGYTVTGTTNTTSIEIVIPNEFNGIPVTTIDGAAFCGRSFITSITIPESVTSIGDYAFYGCTSLTEIHFNAKEMNDLSSGNYAFCRAGQYGSGITVTIGANVTRIPSYLFNPGSNLTREYPNISAFVFEEGSRCTSIGEYLFWWNESLTSITIPDSVTSIGEYAFGGCRGLLSLAIGENVAEMGLGVFTLCTSLISVVIPGSLAAIGDLTFNSCTSLETVTICEGVTSIGNAAFKECDLLTSVVIPSSMTFIDYNAFPGGTSLMSVYYSGSSSDWSKISVRSNNNGLTSATVYYYSEIEPTGSGNYWHYVDGEVVTWTKN